MKSDVIFKFSISLGCSILVKLNLEMFVFELGGEPSEQGENQEQTQPTHGT